MTVNPAHNPGRRRLLATVALSALTGSAGAARVQAREPQLARNAPPGLDPAGWLVSEKLDGVRALWDGQRLAFRSGLPVAAPGWFTAGLPARALDGELWLGRGRFEALSGTVRRASGLDENWRAVRYMLFDLPGEPGPFAERARRLEAAVHAGGWPACVALQQARVADATALRHRLDAVVAGGGEGLMLHRADALWQPGRSDALLKLKPQHDAEATVIGHLPGRGRHAGRLGALQVRTKGGVTFLLGTGFSDAQRDQPPAAGSTVSYAYRGTTAGGVPRFASFLRVHEPF